jgi:tetratricopeptide (TPR) repeat protein
VLLMATDDSGASADREWTLLTVLYESGGALEAATPAFDLEGHAARLRAAARTHGLLPHEPAPENELAISGDNLEEESLPFDVDTGAARLGEVGRAQGLLRPVGDLLGNLPAERWNVANVDAEQLLWRRVLAAALVDAIECSRAGRWEEAYKLLDRAGQAKGADAGQIRQARALVHFNHAQALADEEKFNEALRHASASRELLPDHPVVAGFAAELARLAPEEANIRHLREAHESLGTGHYTDAIGRAERVPRGSGWHGEACALLAVAHLRRGIERAKADQFDDAIADLEKARNLVSDDAARRHIARQLEEVREARAPASLAAIYEALQRGDLQRAEELCGNLPERSPAREQAPQAVGAVFFKRGIEHGNAGRLQEAVADLEKALSLVRDKRQRRHIESQLNAVRETAVTAALNEALMNGDLRRAWELACTLPARSRIRKQACRAVVVGYANRGVEHANARRYASAVADLHTALRLAEGAQEIRHIKETRHINSQLAAVVNAQQQVDLEPIMHALKFAIEHRHWREAERLLEHRLRELGPGAHPAVDELLRQVRRKR